MCFLYCAHHAKLEGGVPCCVGLHRGVQYVSISLAIYQIHALYSDTRFLVIPVYFADDSSLPCVLAFSDYNCVTLENLPFVS